MKILLTGIAGFIGSYVAEKLIPEGHDITGLDNLNDYYDPRLKIARLERLGFAKDRIKSSSNDAISPILSYHGNDCAPVIHTNPDNGSLRFIRMDINETGSIESLFDEGHFDIVIHLAARAGARDSVKNPRDYILSNIDGFFNILEGCRLNGVKHLVYASSSSVYGLNVKTPFSEDDPVSRPASLYAATKKSNELMAHAYSHLYGLPTTGLRLFTVYGPWGRPDMAPYLFIDSILHDRPIKVFNNGELLRDFTYVDDAAEAIKRIATIIPEPNPDRSSNLRDESSSSAPYRIFNVGNSNPVRLTDFIDCIEKEGGKQFHKEYLAMQPGDVLQTFSDSSALRETIGFSPSTPLSEGIRKTMEWQRNIQF